MVSDFRTTDLGGRNDGSPYFGAGIHPARTGLNGVDHTSSHAPLRPSAATSTCTGTTCPSAMSPLVAPVATTPRGRRRSDLDLEPPGPPRCTRDGGHHAFRCGDSPEVPTARASGLLRTVGTVTGGPATVEVRRWCRRLGRGGGRLLGRGASEVVAGSPGAGLDRRRSARHRRVVPQEQGGAAATAMIATTAAAGRCRRFQNVGAWTGGAPPPASRRGGGLRPPARQ